MIVAPLAKALQGTLGGFLPTGTGGGGGGPLNILPPLYHSGGTMGEPSGFRMVPASIFAGAPRFHSGIGPGELPAILRHDKSVLTPKQMAQLAPKGGWGGGGPSNQQVNIHNYSGGQVKTQRRQSGNTQRHRYRHRRGRRRHRKGAFRYPHGGAIRKPREGHLPVRLGMAMARSPRAGRPESPGHANPRRDQKRIGPPAPSCETARMRLHVAALGIAVD